MKVAVTGATGAIGRKLIRELVRRGDEVTALSRDAARAREALGADVNAVTWRDPKAGAAPVEGLRAHDAVVHLLGESVAQRWTDAAKREIRDSRVLGTRNLVAGIAAVAEAERPRVLVSGSATGVYGPRGDERVDERTDPGDDFLARVVVDWEREAMAAAPLGMRVALARTGVVLSEAGGALEKMLPFFRLGIGGPVAGGRQYVPWIHVDDVVGALAHLLDRDAAHGPANLTAPQPVTNAELSKTLGRVLRRPAFAPVPGAAVRLLYGEMATLVTTGVRALPTRLRELEYRFHQPDLEPALRSATGKD